MAAARDSHSSDGSSRKRGGQSQANQDARGRKMKTVDAVLGLLLTTGLSLGSLSGLTGCTSPNPEYPVTETCTPGVRQCSAAAASAPQQVAQVCGRDADDRLTLIDEPCPLSAACTEGRCLSSPTARACQSNIDCAGSEVCVPLVQNSQSGPQLAQFCVPAANAPYKSAERCTRDSDCQSYRCLQHAVNRYCLASCAAVNVCQPGSQCRTFNVTVTGVQGMLRSCSPE